MPERSPDIIAWLHAHMPVIYGASLSVVIAVLRVMYSGGSGRQQVLEGALCGTMTLAMVAGFDLFGLPITAAAFVGGLTGFMGVEKARRLAGKFLDTKIK